MDRACSGCGGTDWRELLDTSYPERRRDRDRTVKTVYKCRECGVQGRHFSHHDGPDIYSGAFRR